VPVVYFFYPETSNRTLEDLDEYFDVDSCHKTIIPIGDKIAKSTARPQEALDAERRRIAEATERKVAVNKGQDVFIEHHESA
jgi:hypothetical protein